MNHYDLGIKGEQLAVDHLQGLGYQIIHTNWRFRKYEVDIIASNEDEIVFVEVKLRTEDHHGDPYEFVNRTKQRNLIRAADAFVEQKEIDKNLRFDIVGIVLNKEVKINHIIDAFHT